MAAATIGGNVFSLAMAGGGVQGGRIHGSSDRRGAYPVEDRVLPQDITATIFSTLGYQPSTEMHDNLNRPLPISRGDVIRQLF